jgi:HSP20 family protein
MTASRIAVARVFSHRLAGTMDVDKFSRMEREVSMLFDRLFAPAHPFRPVAEGGWHPFTDIYESQDQYLIRMELAGIDADRLEVVKEGRCLIVRGERRDPLALPTQACHQLEISYGPFERVVCLPTPFREETVRAEYGSGTGFLLITIDKE